MFFDKFLERISFFTGNKIHQKNNSRIVPLLRPSKDESERLTLEEANRLIAEKKHRQALNIVNATIESGISTNQLMLKKAFLLSQNKEYEAAHKIWVMLSKIENEPRLADLAKQSLETSKKIQHESIKATKLLIDNLHAEAKQYQRKLRHLQKSENCSPDANLIQLIRKEAEIARADELPKLSLALINETLLSGIESPMLVHDKALCISMMGQQEVALELLKNLNQEIKNQEIKDSISKSIEEITKNAKHYESKATTYLAKQARSAAKHNGLEIQFLPEANQINDKVKLKSLIFQEARAALNENPKASFDLINAILDYAPGDLAPLQLKGEALAALNQYDEAIAIWKDLAKSTTKKIAQKASELISKVIAEKAIFINTNESSKAAISYFICEHFKNNLTPTLSIEAIEILKQLDTHDILSSDPQLQKHQLQLQFKTLVIDYLEARLSKISRLNASATDQKPGTIGKTDLKAG
uniref:hypothetical protein n=1 Tax=Synechococcus sp. UW106 TaxID=368495 RepID=UPI000E0F6E08|nr:hypothetical protein [Synechococcus sp. UW106]